MKFIEGMIFDEERALYGSDGVGLRNCRFEGERDGESAFKESRNISTEKCDFNMRYPFWHDDAVSITECEMTELCRAALWYSNDVEISGSKLHGIKAVRECQGVKISDCDVISPEFGWFSSDILAENSSFVSEYFMLRAKGLRFNNVNFKGKYSFQYIEDSVFENCNFDTKDAFWHGKNITVRNSVVKGEYLAWYCEDVTFENCTIIGTQPLCYCKNLRLVNCEMVDCDLSFEKSTVDAELRGFVHSVKNPCEGRIIADKIGEIIDEYSLCEIIERKV